MTEIKPKAYVRWALLTVWCWSLALLGVLADSAAAHNLMIVTTIALFCMSVIGVVGGALLVIVPKLNRAMAEKIIAENGGIAPPDMPKPRDTGPLPLMPTWLSNLDLVMDAALSAIMIGGGWIWTGGFYLLHAAFGRFFRACAKRHNDARWERIEKELAIR